MAANDHLSEIHESVARTTRLVLVGSSYAGGESAGYGGETTDEGSPIPISPSAYQQAVDKAVQSVAQTTALALQDAGNMMRNVATVEVTAIGAATAKWIQDPSNSDYQTIITNSVDTINNVAAAYTSIGEAVIGVLEKLNVG